MSDCLFCKIVEKQIPAQVIYEDAHTVAFEDIHPQAPTHTLVIPRTHLPDMKGLGDAQAELLGHLMVAASKVAEAKGLAAFRTVINTGAEAGQTVFHLHLHLLAGRPMGWPPG
jgi:histidine triad (HIT) family protein